MIATVTLNPALDYVMQLDRLLPGETNRSREEQLFPGGKGINVAAVLTALGEETCALCFLAGFTGRALEQLLQMRRIPAEGVRVKKGMTRINVKIKAEEETEINGSGPAPDESEQEQLLRKLAELQDGDGLVLAGSIPASLPQDIYVRILTMLQDKKILTVVDTIGEGLLACLPCRPFLIKPNREELETLVGRTLSSREEIAGAAKELQQRGARNVLVSLAGEGALLFTEAGESYERQAPRGSVRNSVGAGDSMVAGFLTGYRRRGSWAEALKLGIACGSATAFCEDLADAMTIDRIYLELED